MKGRTIVRVNQATLVEALQEYLSTRMPKQTVIAVCHVTQYCSSGEAIGEAAIELEAEEPKP